MLYREKTIGIDVPFGKPLKMFPPSRKPKRKKNYQCGFDAWLIQKNDQLDQQGFINMTQKPPNFMHYDLQHQIKSLKNDHTILAINFPNLHF